jgi:hypothetical protein
MVMTKGARRKALEHVLQAVFEEDPIVPDECEITNCFKHHQIKDVEGLTNLSSNQIDTLETPIVDSKGNVTLVPLSIADKGKLRDFNYWFHYSMILVDGIDFTVLENFLILDYTDFRDFRYNHNLAMTHFYEGTFNPVDYHEKNSNNNNTALPSQSSASRNIVSDFKRSIKRDSSAFPVLKDERNWDSYQRSLKAVAKAQDLYDVLDPTYVPGTTDEISVFQLKMNFMYAVADSTLLTDYGKTCVHKYESTNDAQSVFNDLFTYMEKSTKASLDSSSLLTYITSTKMGDGSWKGTAHSFILHWQNQVRIYHSMVNRNHRFHDDILLQLLQNAVHPIEELRQVKNQSDQQKTATAQALTYDQYCNLLLSAAQQYDHALSGKRRNPARMIHEHEFHDHVSDPGEFYNIDSDVTTILANAHEAERVYLPKEQ